MKRLHYFNLFFLLSVAVASLIRSWKLVANPDGRNLVVPLEVLGNETNIERFFPIEQQYGAFGLFYLMVAILVVFRLDGHKLFTLSAGAALCSWILFRIALGQAFIPFWHVSLIGVGLFLICSGLAMIKNKMHQPTLELQNPTV